MRNSKTADTMPDLITDEYVMEKCCGSGCDQVKRDRALKLEGAKGLMEFMNKQASFQENTRHVIGTLYECYKLQLK
ncbi:MAG: hypothetical protein V3T88_00140 [Nitrosomonadaceae bacterium]